MTYRSELTAAMTALAQDTQNRFVGYGLTRGRAMGTIPAEAAPQIIETTLAENHMVGFATGLSLMGRLPVVYFERADFLLHAADAIVNHLDKIAQLSRGRFTPAVIIRVTVGNSLKPLFTGITHTRDYARSFGSMVGFPVQVLFNAADIAPRYAAARKRQLAGVSTMLVEYKDMI
jgi:transketolase C-terminal domain/subunit